MDGRRSICTGGGAGVYLQTEIEQEFKFRIQKITHTSN